MDKKIPVIVVGPRGKSLGSKVCQALAQAEGLKLVGSIDKQNQLAVPVPGLLNGVMNAGSFEYLLHEDPDMQGVSLEEVVVFFATKAPALAVHLQDAFYCGLRRFIIGTTGFSVSDMSLIDGIARSGALTVVAPNFLPRVYLLLEMCAMAAQQLRGKRDVVRISEVHHDGKADWPSGTAKKIAEVVAAALGLSQEEVVVLGRGSTEPTLLEKVIVDATRMGGVYGEHGVVFAGPFDRLTLFHEVDDRAGFADAACETIRWIAGQALTATRPQTMVDVFDLAYLKRLRESLPSL